MDSAAVVSERVPGGPWREADVADVGAEPQPEAGADGRHERGATESAHVSSCSRSGLSPFRFE